MLLNYIKLYFKRVCFQSPSIFLFIQIINFVATNQAMGWNEVKCLRFPPCRHRCGCSVALVWVTLADQLIYGSFLYLRSMIKVCFWLTWHLCFSSVCPFWPIQEPVSLVVI